MQFDTNSDMPTLEAQSPIPFPPVDPSPCARITVRVWHRNTMMTVQNVLVKTSTTATPATATTGAARRASGILVDSLPSEFKSSNNNENDQNMSSSSSSFSSDDDEMLDDVDASANTATATTNETSSNAPECAYWMQRTIRDAIYGRVVLAVVLTRMPPKTTTATGPAAVAEWQVTDQKCAIKEMSWQHIRRERHRLAEDPIQEVAALFYLQQQYFAAAPPCITNTATTTLVPPSTWDNPFIAIGADSATTAAATIAATNPDSAMLQTSIQSNILLPLDLLSDDRYLYSILPFCNGGELFDRLDRREKFPEPEARYWMHQILNGVEHLQKAGICHRDLSLENLLVHDTHALVIDMGMCLRIPHVAGTEVDEGFQPLTTTTTTTSISTTATSIAGTIMETTTTSNSAGPLVSSMDQMHLSNTPTTSTIYQMHMSNIVGTTSTATTTMNNGFIATIDHRLLSRHWISPQGTCGKWIYMSPEIYKNQQPFDGHAVDMWAVGVILFLMLTGFPPWERACATDERFYYMTQGYLVQMLTEWNLGLSSDAMDLLQRMFWIDPQDRLSLEQVKAHPWMMKPELSPPPPGTV